MTGQNVVHVKLDYEEAIRAKKDLLSSERDFLRLLKIMKRYSLLRTEELNTKIKIQNRIKTLKINLGRLTKILPKVILPGILKKEDIIEEKISKIKKEEKDKDLESQLMDIQERLKQLG